MFNKCQNIMFSSILNPLGQNPFFSMDEPIELFSPVQAADAGISNQCMFE